MERGTFMVITLAAEVQYAGYRNLVIQFPR
jgi:hypothetical protein